MSERFWQLQQLGILLDPLRENIQKVTRFTEELNTVVHRSTNEQTLIDMYAMHDTRLHAVPGSKKQKNQALPLRTENGNRGNKLCTSRVTNNTGLI
jgi:hypothetical protein